MINLKSFGYGIGCGAMVISWIFISTGQNYLVSSIVQLFGFILGLVGHVTEEEE